METKKRSTNRIDRVRKMVQKNIKSKSWFCYKLFSPKMVRWIQYYHKPYYNYKFLPQKNTTYFDSNKNFDKKSLKGFKILKL